MKNKILITALSLLCCVSFAGCGGGDNPTPINETEIVLSNNRVSLFEAETYQLEPSMKNYVGDTPIFKYISTDASIASVSGSGLITALRVGTCNIQVSFNNYKTLAQVVVNDKPLPTFINLVINSGESAEIFTDDTYQIEAKIKSGERFIEDAKITYTSSNDDIASVSSSGLVTANSEGSCFIDIVGEYDNQIDKKQVIINVNKVENVFGLDISVNELVVGEETKPINFVITNRKNIIKTFNISETNTIIDDNEIAYISGNTIVPVKKGYINGVTRVNFENVDYECEFFLRIREVYSVKYIKTGEIFFVKDGDFIEQTPSISPKDCIFSNWLYRGEYFYEPIEKDMELDASWIAKPLDFTASVYDAISYPNKGERIETKAIYNSDTSIFNGGLKYNITTTPNGGFNVLRLPKIDYSQYSSVSFQWETNSYLGIDGKTVYWYAGGITLGGTIEIEIDATNKTMNVVVTQTREASTPKWDESTVVVDLTGLSYSMTIKDEDILTGKKGLEPIQFLAYEDVIGRFVLLSYPEIVVNESLPLIPDFGKKTYGASYECLDPTAEWEFESKKPRVTSVKEGDFGELNHLDYYEDRMYREDAPGGGHRDTPFKVGLPIINFYEIAKENENISLPFVLGTGIYLGTDSTHFFGQNSVETNGEIIFTNISETSMTVYVASESGTSYNKTITDVDVIKGKKSYCGLFCKIYYAFERHIKIYNPIFDVEIPTPSAYYYSESLFGANVNNNYEIMPIGWGTYQMHGIHIDTHSDTSPTTFVIPAINYSLFSKLFLSL